LPGEDISDKGLEEGLVLSDELGQVHISQCTCDKHFLVSISLFGTLYVTGSTKHGENVTKTEIVVTLLRKLLLAKLVEHVKLLGEGIVGGVTDGGELDLHDDLTVGHHHRHGSELHLEIVGELLTTGITGVHRNEITAGSDKANW
jgi:hypothetical protein